MKIGISCYPTYGGSGVVASELAMALAEGGDEVHVISYAMPSRLVIRSPRLYFHEVVVPRYPLFEYPPYSLALATKMVEVARHSDLDLLHVHYAVPNAISAVLARQIVAPRPLPVVTTLHGTDITLVGSDPSFRETTRYGIEQSDAVTTVSEWLRRRTVEELGVEKADRGGPELRRPGPLRASQRLRRRRPLGRRGREDRRPHLELPAGQAGARRAPGLPRASPTSCPPRAC
jgi:L-malate glycosyltransferase